MRGLRITLTEATASIADIGVLFPIAATLVLVNGVSAGAALGFAGLLFILAGVVYRVPVPVQPIKAAAAIAIATGAPPRVLAAAGIGLGLVLLVLAATRLIEVVAKLFPKPIIRGNQIGVGILLIVTAWRLSGSGADPLGLAVAAGVVAGLMAAPHRRGMVAVAVVGGGIGWSVAQGGAIAWGVALAVPGFDPPSWADLTTAFTLLVIPQIPLTLGNAVIGTADLEREYYGARARRVTVSNLSVSCGLANVGLGFFGGMPLCHGSSGATAYYRFGARTGGVNLVIGGILLAGGVLFAPLTLSVFRLVPPPVLAGLLAYTGVRHAMLVADQRGAALVIAVTMGVVGGLTSNLMWGMAVGLPAVAVVAGARRAGLAVGGAR